MLAEEMSLTRTTNHDIYCNSNDDCPDYCYCQNSRCDLFMLNGLNITCKETDDTSHFSKKTAKGHQSQHQMKKKEKYNKNNDS